ncbi:helix-turn-helix domain-containing protein [Acetobacter oryzifermentans]|uniref:helix-turn-helix domain-containing protein n=1 Tax=Acetobacter oryzifermentans TaxID=1633874 RepID=UPI0039BFD840
MVNHPNRGGGESPSRNPEPTEIKQARSTVGMTQEQAAAVVHSTKRVWYQWEAGLRRMHPAFWELFLIKTTKRNYDPD